MKKIITFAVLTILMLFTSNLKIGAQMTDTVTQVRAKHILVQTQQQANEIKNQIDNNEISFEDAAKKYSQCPSKANGGDLGYFGRRMMVKEFEDAAFNGEVGKVTNPVQTQFGWHLIEVVDKK